MTGHEKIKKEAQEKEKNNIAKNISVRKATQTLGLILVTVMDREKE